MTRLPFYLRYAFRNLTRNARWTIFAVFSIAAGVATVVALRSLGLAIADSLVANVRESNHGDITVARGGGGSFFSANFLNPGSDDEEFSDRELERVIDVFDNYDAQIAEYITYGNLQLTAFDNVTVGRPQFVSAYLIDPDTFPPTQPIRALDPAGAVLSDLLRPGEHDVVISANLATAEGLAVGDTVRASGTEEVFTVRGIVATEQEANVRNPFAAFFGFAYMDISLKATLNIDQNANTISATFPPGTNLDAISGELRERGVYANITTVDELLAQNAVIGDYLGRFIVVMGLGALLIGGVGIINTMLVMVGRRTSEIAALKTFGLKGGQIGALFMAEAFLLGLAGSVVGCAIGVLLSGAVNQYGETFLQQRLTWRIYPEALVYGLGLGMVVTLVFGIVPVLTANRIRPAIILRPNEPSIPAVGCLQSLFALLLVVVVIGGVAGQILGVVWLGVVGVALALVIMALLVGILWLIVWVIGRLPAFGWVDLRLALRNLTARRIRTATTLLALSAGMFALSSITFVGEGTRQILQFQLSEGLGGNVLVFPYANVVSQSIGQTVLTNQLEGIEGIDRVMVQRFYELRVDLLDGTPPPTPDLPFGLEDEMPARARSQLRRFELNATVQNVTNGVMPPGEMAAGRALTPDDRGQRVMVLGFADSQRLPTAAVGSRLTVRLARGETAEFEIVGIFAGTTGQQSFGSRLTQVPPDTLGGLQPDFTLNLLSVSEANLNRVLLDLSALFPPVFVLDVGFIDGLLKRLIDQFSAIPTLVGLLSLMAAAVIMANTVSLATLERRRQIGVLKTVGLKGRRVLFVMLLENTLVGLLGGLLGIGLSALFVALMTAAGIGETIPIPTDARLTAVALVAASVVIAWIATLASARVAVGERVTNVLRYE